jgi:hypothetical protein
VLALLSGQAIGETMQPLVDLTPKPIACADGLSVSLGDAGEVRNVPLSRPPVDMDALDEDRGQMCIRVVFFLTSSPAHEHDHTRQCTNIDTLVDKNGNKIVFLHYREVHAWWSRRH